VDASKGEPGVREGTLGDAQKCLGEFLEGLGLVFGNDRDGRIISDWRTGHRCFPLLIVEPGEKRSFLSAGIAAFASSFYAVQRTDCGRIDWRPIGIEHRAMAGTIPARLEAVPVQMAADMAAGRRTKVQLPAFVAIRVNDKVFADLSGMRPGS
jgi:hypothetical protein